MPNLEFVVVGILGKKRGVNLPPPMHKRYPMHNGVNSCNELMSTYIL